MAVYSNTLVLTELSTGEGSGTWGTTTNTNLELIGEAFSFGTEAIATNADTHGTTIAEGSTDPGRSLFLKYTGTLDSTCTVTILPNTVSKLWFIENATSGSQSIIISQGTGASVTIPAGQTKAIYSDGAGSGAAMIDAFQDLSVPDLFIDDDLTFTSDSAVISFGADADTTLTHTDGSGLTLNSTNKIMFNDASQFIQGSSATVLSLGATDEIDLTATAIDVNGTIDVSGNATLGGTLGVTGAVTANAGVVVDNITIDGTEIDLSSGDLTVDVAGDIILDAAGDNILIKDAGTHYANITMSSNNLLLDAVISDGDLLFRGNDGGSTITALTLDMSAAGKAIFNSHIALGDSKQVQLGADADFIMYHDGTSNYVQAVKQDSDIILRGNDGGSGVNMLTLDTSAAGKATFNAGATFGDNVGINTTAPAYALDVDSTIHIGNDGGSSFSHSRLIFDANGAGRAAGNFFHNQADDVEYFAGSPYNKSDSFAICRNATASHADATSNITNALVVVDSAGNLHVGGSTTPSSSAGNLVLNNGTAPSGSATNGVVLYAEDVSSSSELKVRDEAGNVTTLSPHNFDLIPDGPSEDMAWSYFSERDGKRINVDMLKALRVLEQISGEQLIFEN